MANFLLATLQLIEKYSQQSLNLINVIVFGTVYVDLVDAKDKMHNFFIMTFLTIQISV